MTNINFKPEKCFHLRRPSAVVVLNISQKSGVLFVHTFIHVWNVAFIEVSCTASQINKLEPTLRLKRRDPVEVLVVVFFVVFQSVEFYCSHFTALFISASFLPVISSAWPQKKSLLLSPSVLWTVPVVRSPGPPACQTSRNRPVILPVLSQ